MELHQVRCFVAMARTLDPAQSADACEIARAAMDEAIRRLELEVGGQLFAHADSHLELTELGRLMQPGLERMYEAAEAARERSGVTGSTRKSPLALAVAAEVRSNALDEAISEIEHGLPQIELSVTATPTDELFDPARAGPFDLVIAEQPGDARGMFQHWRLFSECPRSPTGSSAACAAQKTGEAFGEREIALIAMGNAPSPGATAFVRAARARSWVSGS